MFLSVFLSILVSVFLSWARSCGNCWNVGSVTLKPCCIHLIFFSLFKLYLISKPVTFHREWKHFEISLLCLFYHILRKCTHALDLGRFTDWWTPFDHNIFIKNSIIYRDWKKIKIKKQASSLWYLMHEVGYSNMCISPPSSNSSITYWQPFSCTINLPLSRCGKSENFSPYASYILGKGPTFMALRQMSFPGHESQKRCILSAADVFPFLL